MTTEPLLIEFRVGCSPEHAFDTWCRRTSMWWPKRHSRSGDPNLEVTIEGRVGGRIYERTASGDEHDWGEITAWEPPHRLGYLWHIYGTRDEATDVDIRFLPSGDETVVRITHGGWERLGTRGEGLRERNRRGWAGLLPSFEAACEAA